MIIAKITPTATKVTQVTPFSSETKTLDYMTAIARPYVVGASETGFQVSFGTVEVDSDGKIVKYNNETNERLVLTSEELSTWGTNDESLLTIIANKLNVTISKFETVESNMF
jgi:hypothetical protein